MSSILSSPVISSKRRKRRQSRSPDLFGGDDNSLLEFDSDGSQVESTPVSQRQSKCDTKKIGLCKTPLGRKTRLFDIENSTPLRKALSPVTKKTNKTFGSPGLTSSVKCSTQYSVSSSLKSTSESVVGGGLNSRLRSVISANKDSTLKLDITNTCSSNETQAVYTLNRTSSNTAITQGSEYSGPFYGLSEEIEAIIKTSKNIPSLYDWQKDCLEQACSSKRNLLYSLPTSGGKTLVSEILMIRELLCAKKHCLYVLPYVSIVQEKVRTLSPLAVSLNFAVEEFAGNRGSIPPRQRKSKRVIYIATLEKAHGIVNSLMELGRLQEIGLVVVDEVHIVGEVGKRGAVLETLLCKLLLSPVSPRIIAMSATIGNINELADFLKAEVYTDPFRPVELKEYIKLGDSLLLVNSKDRRRDDILKNDKTLVITHGESRKTDPDGLAALVNEVAPTQSCLVFCPTKKNCESVAQLISRNTNRSVLECKTVEKRRLWQALKEESGQICPVLKTTIPFGIAYHHSGLTGDERQLIEEAFLSGVLCCLCCTSTLAAGVNLPARRVILRSPYMGSSRLTRARYQQMVGRAGRAGFDTQGESILIIKQNELSFVIDDILLAPTDRVESQLIEDDLRGLQHLILGVVALDLGATNRQRLAETLLQSTLLGQQGGRSSTSGQELIDMSVNNLIEKQLLKSTEEGQLEVTKLGRATLKGCVDLERASHLYKDLRQAQAGLVLLSKLHLMYLVTPYDLVGTINPVPSTYFHAFNKLSTEEVGVARNLGINEAVVVKLMSCQEVKVERAVLQRFYLTLMLNDLWKGESFWNVSEMYGCSRGDVQNLLTSAASFASCVYHFTQELDEFWAFSELLLPFSRELSLCCTSELIPLLELPSVAKGRARLLYKAGFRTLTDVAKADPSALVQRIEHLPRRIAQQIVAAAKVLVYEKADALREEADLLLNQVSRPLGFQAPLIDETFQSQASNVSLID